MLRGLSEKETDMGIGLFFEKQLETVCFKYWTDKMEAKKHKADIGECRVMIGLQVD